MKLIGVVTLGRYESMTIVLGDIVNEWAIVTGPAQLPDLFQKFRVESDRFLDLGQ
jgi:hypothetical protein